MPEPDFSNNKLGGRESIVQIDETMFSYKCKSHQGRSSYNRTDSLCIFERKERIVKAFTCVIANIEASTLVPIITRNVTDNSIIWQTNIGVTHVFQIILTHHSVCHKYRFIADEGLNTQAIKSFNIELKLAIKTRKGVKTEKREHIIKKFFKFINRGNLIVQFCYL